jgi:hypothetical protein
MDVEDASRALWEAGWRLTAALSPSGPNLQAFHFSSWLDVACSLLKAQGKRIILTDYPAQDVPWHVLGMQLTAAACLGNVGAMCGELLKWCHANGVPLVEAMEGL